MTLTAYGEIHFLNGEASLFARFAQANGASFDLPLSAEQFQVLLAGLESVPQTAPPIKKQAEGYDDDEVEDEDARPFAVAAGSSYDADDL
jgi:hypothetical protein